MQPRGACDQGSNRVSVSELCQIPRETPVKHGAAAGYFEAHRCCGKSLMESALVRVDVRQHTRPASISKRAQSTTLTSLRLESTICERSQTRLSHVGCNLLAFYDRLSIQRLTSHEEKLRPGIVSDVPIYSDHLRFDPHSPRRQTVRSVDWDQPNVNANVSTPASRNSISNCRSTIGFG